MANDLKLRISLKGMAAVKSAFNDLKRRARSLGKSLSAAFSRVARSVRTLTRHMRRLGVVFAGLIGLSIKNAATYETLKLRLKTVTGSAKEAEKVFNRLFKLSIKTQFTPVELIDAAILLRAFGQDGEEAINSIAEAAAAMTKPIKDVAAVIGSLETEPLRRLGIEFEKTGTSGVATFRDKLGNEIQKSADGIDNLRKMLLEVFTIKFGGTLVEASRTITGLLSTLKGNVQAAFATVGAEIAPIFKVFIDKLNNVLTKAFKEGGPLTRLGKQLEEFGIQFSAAVVTMFQSFEQFKKILIDIGDVIQTGIFLGFVKSIPVLVEGFKQAGIVFITLLGKALGRTFPIGGGAKTDFLTIAQKGFEDAVAELKKDIKPVADRLRDSAAAIRADTAKRKGAGEPGGDPLGGAGGVGADGSITSIGLGDLRKRRFRFNRLDKRGGGEGFRTTSDAEVKGFGSGGSLSARAKTRIISLGLGRPTGFIPPEITESTKKAKGFVPGQNFGKQFGVIPSMQGRQLTGSQLQQTKFMSAIARNTHILASKVSVAGSGAGVGGGSVGAGAGGSFSN